MLFTTTGWIVFGALCACRLTVGLLKAWQDADDSIEEDEKRKKGCE